MGDQNFIPPASKPKKGKLKSAANATVAASRMGAQPTGRNSTCANPGMKPAHAAGRRSMAVTATSSSAVTAGPSTSRSGAPANAVTGRPSSAVTATSTSAVTATSSSSVASVPSAFLRLESKQLAAKYRQIEYGRFLRTMLEECIVDQKMEQEEKQMQIQMGQLTERFQNNLEEYHKISNRLKEISSTAKLQRLHTSKINDCNTMYSTVEKSKVQEHLQKLNMAEDAALNNLQTKNVDFGYSKESGHQQLLDAVNEANDGLEQMKKVLQIDAEKIREYHDCKLNIDKVESVRSDLTRVTKDFEEKFPFFNERLVKEASETIAKSLDDDSENKKHNKKNKKNKSKKKK